MFKYNVRVVIAVTCCYVQIQLQGKNKTGTMDQNLGPNFVSNFYLVPHVRVESF